MIYCFTKLVLRCGIRVGCGWKGVFVFDEDFSPCRLQASLVSLRFGHAQGKTTLSCFLTLSRRFATIFGWDMRSGFDELALIEPLLTGLHNTMQTIASYYAEVSKRS